ncbi:MAG: hypothetical protein GX592_05425 [Clostridiales bacterium]|nr:hypothetical protein [Clostridiales bacterium]
MGIFSSAAEATRKQNLRELEDKRLRFAKRLTDEGFSAQACLFAQYNGGFTAVAKCGADICLIKGPAPGANEDFAIRRVSAARARCEEVLIKSEGLGGLLGFGKKGGAGFKLIVDTPDADEFAIEIVAGLNSFLEIKGGKNGLLNPKRRRGNANFVWDFRPVEREHVAPLRSRWMKLINEIAETAETAETAQ